MSTVKTPEEEAKPTLAAVGDFNATVRIDTPQEIRYYQNGGILPYVLRQLISGRSETPAPGGISSVGDARTGSVPT